MIRIAIVEDEKEQSELLSAYLKKYEDENKCKFELSCFFTADTFLNCDRNFDIVFMDIELPDGNGMDIARRLREDGRKTLVIFVTNLAHYAVKGYEVRAFDFIVKPIAYYNFVLKFSGALDCLRTMGDTNIWIKNKDGMIRLAASRIVYVEVLKHYLTYHTKDGDFTALGSIGKAALDLKDAAFSFCNRCYLVNLKYVSRVTQSQAMVGGAWLNISRHKRTEFLKDLNEFLSLKGGNLVF